MPIIFSSETQDIRGNLSAFLSRMSAQKTLRVLDAGGGFNQWMSDIVTDVIDINPRNINSKLNIVIGDINEDLVWSNFKENEFDFSICTHTLEDIRDPKFVIEQLSRVSKCGFIAVPNRFVEFRNVEDSEYLGYGHHRWVFHINKSNKLQAVAKWIAISNKRVINRFNRNKFYKLFSFLKLESELYKFLSDTSNKHIELGIIWINTLDFSYFNNDFAGETTSIMKAISLEFLSSEFIIYDSRISWENQLENTILTI
jgi:hypothetical protein